MKFEIKYQEKYSRAQLLLRSFFGIFYIGIPHFFVLLFISVWVQIITLIAWFSILFNGQYPKDLFEQVVGYYRWYYRVLASLTNLFDGYPEFTIDAQADDKVILEVPYPENVSREQLLLTWLFGTYYVLIPHGFVLFFISIWVSILNFLAWFIVLFTGKYPKQWHETSVNYYRWTLRVSFYQFCLIPNYPPFSGKRDEEIL